MLAPRGNGTRKWRTVISTCQISYNNILSVNPGTSLKSDRQNPEGITFKHLQIQGNANFLEPLKETKIASSNPEFDYVVRLSEANPSKTTFGQRYREAQEKSEFHGMFLTVDFK